MFMSRYSCSISESPWTLWVFTQETLIKDQAMYEIKYLVL